MNMEIMSIANAVRCIPHGSPSYELAVAVCILSNMDPSAYNSGLGLGLTNWQAEIMRAALLVRLGTTL